MDKMIQDIVAIDHKCAQAVKEAQEKKAHVSANMSANKKEIYDSFAKEFEKTLNEKKAELRSKIDATKKTNEEDYQASLQSLSEIYEKHRDEWIHTIVERCKEI